MTAAHCTSGLGPHNIWAIMGMINRNEPGEGVTIRVERKEEHPEVDVWNLEFDIALLKLEREVDFSDPALSHIFPVCWPTRHENPGEWAIMSGWGYLEQPNNQGEEPSVKLQMANVTIIDRDVCGDLMDGELPDHMMCAGDEGQGACYGDSGGPLVALNPSDSDESVFELVGAVSWSLGPCASKPTVFVDVFNVIDWMRSVAGNECPRSNTGRWKKISNSRGSDKTTESRF